MPIAKVNNIDIWYETFGNKEHDAVLLIMGGCCQGILWPTEFCEQLSNAGFFVIRYDHRDTGLSSYFDFENNPYTMHDMMTDAISLLDYLAIQKFQLVGLSMGAPIAELISVHYPERTKGQMLIASSCDFRPMNLAYAGKPPEPNSLPRTKDIYLQWMNKFMSAPIKNEEELIRFRVEGWNILSGDKVPFEEKRYYELHKQFIHRALHPESHLNHLHICRISEDIVSRIPSEVTVPTVVIHGSEDPIVPPDHGKALAKAIKSSKYILVEGLGHVPNCHFYSLIIQQVQLMRA